MPTDSPSPSDQGFEPVGAVLARWRKRRKITGQALGDMVGMSQAKISRMENGVVAAEPGDVRAVAEALDVPAAEINRLVRLVETADNRLTEWVWAHEGLAGSQAEIEQIETTAQQLRVFQPAVIPGLLQTSEYARAILTQLKDELEAARLADSPAAVSEAVTARLRRSEMLAGAGREFYFLITEQVLRNRVCRPADMIAQIARLREVNALPNVSLRIIPGDAELPIAPFHGFILADERWVSVDLFNTAVRSKGRKTVSTYRRAFDALDRAAVAEIDPFLDRYQVEYVRMMLPSGAAN
jgi:transcriptional regulator with XRE-family HTH domain